MTARPSLVSQTFTPNGQTEAPKRCSNCDKLLASNKFKMHRVTRNGTEGIIREAKCRDCSNHKNVEKKKRYQTKMEETVLQQGEKISKQQETIQELEKCFKGLQSLVLKQQADIEDLRLSTSVAPS